MITIFSSLGCYPADGTGDHTYLSADEVLVPLATSDVVFRTKFRLMNKCSVREVLETGSSFNFLKCYAMCN
jgi:hypothetical protein